MLTLFWSLVACSRATPEPAPEAPPAQETAPKPPADPIPTAASPEDYGDAWLVLVQSSRETGAVPPSWPALSASTIQGLQPARTNSGLFKGLMPCYEIVVAGASKDKAAAVAMSTALKGAGVDNYVKNAGPFVGEDPRVSAACSAAAVAGADSGVTIAVSRGGALRMPVPLADAVSERILSEITDYQARGDALDSWFAPLPVQTVGVVSVGQGFSVSAEGATERCTVTGFEAITEGQPHFGYYEQGDTSRPGCGAPRVHATLDCDLGEVALVSAEGGPTVSVHGLAAEQAEALPGPARQHESFQAALSEMTAAAREKGEPLVEIVELGAADGLPLQLASVTMITGEGLNECGGDDLNTTVSAILGADGTVAMPFIEMSWATPAALVQIDGERHWLTSSWTGTWALLRANGDTRAQWYREFCDCAC